MIMSHARAILEGVSYNTEAPQYVRDHARDLDWMLHKHLQLPPKAQLNVLQEQAVNDCVNGSKQEGSWFDRFVKARQSRAGEGRRFA